MGRLFVYCGIPSQGAYELVKALDATRLRKFDGMDFWTRAKRLKLQPGDNIVCWGKPIPSLEGIKILNSGSSQTKFDDQQLLADHGVRCVMISKTFGNGYYLPRTYNHQGGKDLLNPPTKPDFYAYKYNFSREFRIHSFDGRSIRAGEKVLRDGYRVGTEEDFRNNFIKGGGELLAHPWIRSYDAGWKIKYDDFHSDSKLKKLSNAAIKALKLTFGAVDIGERTEDGMYYVIEVNRAPGIEGNSIASYVRAIQRWIKEDQEEVVVDNKVAPPRNAGIFLEDVAPVQPLQGRVNPPVVNRVINDPQAAYRAIINYGGRANGIRLGDAVAPAVAPVAPPVVRRRPRTYEEIVAEWAADDRRIMENIVAEVNVDENR